MPLHFGKLFAFIVLLTVAAFVLWLLWGAFFAGETVEEPAAFNQGSPQAKVAAPAA